MTREATCSCGQLRVTANGDPERVYVCHCVECQRRTGSAFGVTARFSRDQIAVTGLSREYERISDRGVTRTLHFCPTCGTTVFWTNTAAADVGIAVGAFADPAFPAPTASFFETRRHPWAAMPESVEHYETVPVGGGKKPG